MDYKYKAVFLDFDGTFADSGRGVFECLDYACDCLGIDRLTADNRRKFIGPPLYESFTKILGCTHEQAEYGISKYREMYKGGGMLKLDLYPGITDFIKEMNKAGIKTAICSSKPQPFVIEILKSLNMYELIDFASCPEGDKAEKSKEQMINDSVNYFKLDKKDCVMVGDRMFDIDGANLAGVDSIGVTYGYGTEEELKAHNATYIAASVNDVKELVFSQV